MKFTTFLCLNVVKARVVVNGIGFYGVKSVEAMVGWIFLKKCLIKNTKQKDL